MTGTLQLRRQTITISMTRPEHTFSAAKIKIQIEEKNDESADDHA
jgi:hypothetical protein